MGITKRYLCLTTAALLATTWSCLAQESVFKDGDRICFLGSSIAMNGECFHFTNLFYATRYPDRDVRFFNCGVSGQWTDSILARIDSDVLVNRPTWCVLMIEENDLNSSLYSESRKNQPGIKELQQKQVQHWMDNADLIVEKLRESGVKVVLQTPSIYDQTMKGGSTNEFGMNDGLKQCAEHLKELGAKYSLPVVDCWTALLVVNEKIQKEDPTKTIIGSDRVHVSPAGHFIMSVEFLRAQKVKDTVSHIAIDAQKNAATLSENCAVSGLDAKPTSVTFTVKAESLPFPTPNEIKPDQYLDFTDSLNKEILQVQGLNDGNYTLAIDGTTIGDFSKEELNKGINLSKNRNIPQYKQAEKVLGKLREFWKNESQLRSIKHAEYQLGVPKGVEDIDELMAQVTKMVERYKSGSGANANYFKTRLTAYLENKPKEKELFETREAIWKDLGNINKPEAHTYKISAKSGN